jgi:hypothetical protein
MFERRRAFLYLGAVALAASLVACGGDNGVPPTAPSTPAPPPPPVVVSGATGLALEADVLARVVFEATRSGTLDATVDWTFPENDLDVGILGGNCSFEQFLGNQCPIVAISASTTAKPERISGAVNAGTYTLFIENTGPGDETISYQVVLTPNASASASGRSGSSAGEQWKGRARTFVELQ